TMRLLAEERKLRTLELLLTSPVSEIAIVLAKFTASMSLIVVMLLLSGSYAAALAWFGDPDFGPIYSGYFGLLLFGAALVGTGLLASPVGISASNSNWAWTAGAGLEWAFLGSRPPGLRQRCRRCRDRSNYGEYLQACRSAVGSEDQP